MLISALFWVLNIKYIIEYKNDIDQYVRQWGI